LSDTDTAHSRRIWSVVPRPGKDGELSKLCCRMLRAASLSLVHNVSQIVHRLPGSVLDNATSLLCRVLTARWDCTTLATESDVGWKRAEGSIKVLTDEGESSYLASCLSLERRARCTDDKCQISGRLPGLTECLGRGGGTLAARAEARLSCELGDESRAISSFLTDACAVRKSGAWTHTGFFWTGRQQQHVLHSSSKSFRSALFPNNLLRRTRMTARPKSDNSE